MDKPIILISTGNTRTAAVEDELQSVESGCNVLYVNAVLRAGGVPLLLPQIDDEDAIRAALSLAHGVLFTGGGDIVSLEYGEEPHRSTRHPDPERDRAELALARIAQELEMPVLGICRGMQLLNVAAGGTLVQDIPSQVPESIQHGSKNVGPVAGHSIEILPDSILSLLMGATTIRVNSFHHQAVKDPGIGWRITARARDGVAEAMETEDGAACLAVQWHPEELAAGDHKSRTLFSWLVEEARRYAGETSVGSVTYTEANSAIRRIGSAVLLESIRKGANEIHIQATEKGAKISCAVGGKLEELMTVPKHIQARLIDYYREYVGLATQERGEAQEGSAIQRCDDGECKVYVAFQPSPVGESVFVRLERL